MERRNKPRRKLGVCVKCERRQARYAEGTCGPCYSLIRAEGVKPQGLRENNRDKALKIRKWRVQKYNKLIAAGFTLRQVAQMWNLAPSFLSHYMTQSRRMGFDAVIVDRRIAVAAPKKARLKVSVHGQGWGIRGCKCEPCLIALRAKRLDYQRRYRANKKLLAQQQSDAPL